MRRLGVQVSRHLRSSVKGAGPARSLHKRLRAEVARPGLFIFVKASALLFIALGLLTPFPAEAFWSNYRVFKCGSSYEAYKCQTCRRLPALRFGFEVDISRQMVAFTVLENAQPGVSQILLNCSVNSKESWACGQKSTRKSGKLVASTSYSMTNGLFTAENASVTGSSSEPGFYCGKL